MSTENPTSVIKSEGFKKLSTATTLIGGAALAVSACTAEQIQDFEAQTHIDVPAPIEQEIINFQLPKPLDPIIISEAVDNLTQKVAEDDIQAEQEPEPRNLRKLFNKKAKLPKGNLEEIRTELFKYLADNPEIDEKVRAINPGFDPDEYFEFCISGKSDMKLTGCANTLIFFMQVHKISNSEDVYDMTAGLMGATKYDMGSTFKSIYDYEMNNQKKHPELYE